MENNSSTVTRSEIIPNSPMTIHDWIGNWKVLHDYWMVALWSPGKTIGQRGPGSELDKDSLLQKPGTVVTSSFPMPLTSSVQESAEDMKLGISHFLLSEVRESTASDVPEKESRWSDLIAILHRIESDDSNRASRIFQDVRNIIVDFSEGGFQWHGTLDSPPRTVSENSNWAFERLSKINEVAAKESRWSDLIAIPPRMGSDDSNRGSRILQDVRNIIVNFSEGGFQWHSTLGSPPKTVSENSNWAFERLSKINEVAAKRIGDLARLQQDWDGYGGEPIAQEAINRTAGLLMIIQGLTGGKLQNPFIAPLPDGGLELEWEMDSGVELTLIVRGGGREIKYLLDVPNDSGGIEESEGLLPKDASLSELVTGLI